MNRITISMIGLAALSGCVNSADEPTVTSFDVDRAFDRAVEISELPVTSSAALPAGTVIYNGQLGANVAGDANGSILGDMTMRVDFADNDIDGSVTNINLIDPDGTPNQRLSGSLNIDGVEDQGQLDAFASGDLTGVDNDGYDVDTQMLLRLDGEVHDDFGGGDAVFGSATGQARGEFNLDVDGVFFGTQD